MFISALIRKYSELQFFFFFKKTQCDTRPPALQPEMGGHSEGLCSGPKRTDRSGRRRSRVVTKEKEVSVGVLGEQAKLLWQEREGVLLSPHFPGEIWKHREIMLALKEKRELWTQFGLEDYGRITTANFY